MTEVLYSYLLQHRSLSIPGLGTIYVERAPAQTDFLNKRILPPSFHFRFNKYFDAPDKEFFSYLASQEEMADYEAIRWYNEWAYDLSNKIRTDQQAELSGVGLLKKDMSGEIVFEEVDRIPSPLEAVTANRVIHSKARHTMRVGDRETTFDMTGEYPVAGTYVERESWWIYALIIAAIALVILFFHFYRNGMYTSSVGNQQSVKVAK